MRVLVACEFSGIVRTAFERKGWEAWSCDLLASEQSGNHYQGDALELLDQNWDLLIAHPPCQFLSYAGNKYFNIDKYGQAAIDGSSKDGAKERARFYPKVAEAMSEQWTNFIKNQSINS